MGRGDPLRRDASSASPHSPSTTPARSRPGPDVETDEEILDWVARDAETALHPSCTCRMGVDDMSVVDPATMRVHGLEGLRVVDASVMPLRDEREHLRARDDDRREGRRPHPRRDAARRPSTSAFYRHEPARTLRPATDSRSATGRGGVTCADLAARPRADCRPRARPRRPPPRPLLLCVAAESGRRAMNMDRRDRVPARVADRAPRPSRCPPRTPRGPTHSPLAEPPRGARGAAPRSTTV